MAEGSSPISESVPDALNGERIDRVVSFITGASRSVIAQCIKDGDVRRNGRKVNKGSEKVASGDQIVIYSASMFGSAEVKPDPEIQVPIVYEDEHFVVIDKPSGLVVHPAASQKNRTMANGLLSLYPEIASVGEPERPGIVHRLDKGTSGLLVAALSNESYLSLTAQLQHRTIERIYTALIIGSLEAEKGIVDAPLGRDPKNPVRRAVISNGKEARTRYEVIERFESPEYYTLVKCELETGRTHQIRAHFSAIGHPIAGDTLYGASNTPKYLSRPFLHSCSLAFQHPISAELLRFTSEIPEELQKILDMVQ
ncbi:MAG: RNA pseudouridine synthase [Acidimicrobiaceae bacterium]|nr:RNA pseudouridine synthase [Acidimicrobiaceae bacterium]